MLFRKNLLSGPASGFRGCNLLRIYMICSFSVILRKKLDFKKYFTVWKFMNSFKCTSSFPVIFPKWEYYCFPSVWIAFKRSLAHSLTTPQEIIKHRDVKNWWCNMIPLSRNYLDQHINSSIQLLAEPSTRILALPEIAKYIDVNNRENDYTHKYYGFSIGHCLQLS